jgi:hypothetical protein
MGKEATKAELLEKIQGLEAQIEKMSSADGSAALIAEQQQTIAEQSKLIEELSKHAGSAPASASGIIEVDGVPHKLISPKFFMNLEYVTEKEIKGNTDLAAQAVALGMLVPVE